MPGGPLRDKHPKKRPPDCNPAASLREKPFMDILRAREGIFSNVPSDRSPKGTSSRQAKPSRHGSIRCQDVRRARRFFIFLRVSTQTRLVVEISRHPTAYQGRARDPKGPAYHPYAAARTSTC